MRIGMGRVRCERGFVIAEAAFVIPAISVVAASAIALMAIALTSLGLHGTAHAAARDIARGVPSHSVQARIQASHPQATVAVTPTPQGVAVTVHRDLRIAGGLLGGLSIPLERRVVVPWEMGIGDMAGESDDAK
jgi:hypothetical protein